VTGYLARHSVGAVLPALLAILLAAGPGPSGSLSGAAAADVFDPDAPPETKFRLAPHLTFGADIEFTYDYRKNLGLREGTDNDAAVFTPELSLAFSFDPDPRFQAFLNLAISREFVFKVEADGSQPSEDVALAIQEAFVWIRSLPGGFSLSARAPAFRG
jgi:hypothetical protein